VVETVEGIETVETAESTVFMRFVVHVGEKTELRGKGLGIIPPSPPVFSFAKMLQDCARASEVAGGGAALFEIALVVVFGAIERAGWGDFRGDGLTEFAAGLQRGL
jgi:hypothetical protein